MEPWIPTLIRDECQDLLAQIAEKTARIAERNKKLASLAPQSERAPRLQTMPGTGPLTAIAVEAFGPNMAQFRSGRGIGAWLGLVPRQHSSEGKERLGRMTKAGHPPHQFTYNTCWLLSWCFPLFQGTPRKPFRRLPASGSFKELSSALRPQVRWPGNTRLQKSPGVEWQVKLQ